jgi:hypothetical protein
MRRAIGISLLAGILLVGCSNTAEPAVTTAPEATTAPASSSGVDAPAESQAVAPAVPKPTSFKTLSKRNWQKLVKAPDNYLGAGYKVWACITQFDAATGTDTFRADASYQQLKSWINGDNALFTGYEADLADFVQGDIVSMNVVSLGSTSYDTQIGGNTTVPLFFIYKIKRLKGSC